MPDRSPFPGMDPWLESHWGDVRHTIISSLRRQAFGQLPAGLFAAIEETVVFIDAEWERHDFRPDVAVFGSDPLPGTATAPTPVAIAEPVRLVVPTEPVTESHIEIRELGTGEPLVTAIEVLSPTNKADARGRAAYVRKRDGYYAADANVAELDLLRVGQHLIDVPLEYVRPRLMTSYQCAVRHRRGGRDTADVDYYAFALRHALPRIRLPLRPGDRDVILDLQQCVDEAYAEGGYATRLRYAQPPEPPLSADDAAWAAACVAAARP